MKFTDFLNEAGKDIRKKEKKDLERFKRIVSDRADDRNIVLWIGYKTIQSTKKLVWATWFLAVSTIILAVISLFLR